ncbi:MAG: hypothetical protein LLF97_00080 [Planctomycetaceae bacterium]|nr:hypothetical protein [Planctomycetaceae bacterium]
MYFAPAIVFPLLLGAITGLTIVGFIRFAGIGHRPTILSAVVLSAAIATVGLHYQHYRMTYDEHRTASDLAGFAQQLRPSFAEYLQAQAERGRPLPYGYVARGAMAWITWAIDALLIVAAAVLVTLPALRSPYCNRCETWYRTVRGAKIDQTTARRLAERLGVDEIGRMQSPRFRLSACQGGCGPTRCELSWEEPDGSVAMVRVWLDPAGRNAVAALLDGLESS